MLHQEREKDHRTDGLHQKDEQTDKQKDERPLPQYQP